MRVHNTNSYWRSVGGACGLIAAYFALPYTTRADAFEGRTSAHTALDPTGGAMTDVVSVNVPAGKWVAMAKLSVVSWSDADYVRCGIWVDGVALDGSTTTIGEAGGYPAVAVLANGKVFDSQAPATVVLRCTHDAYIEGEYIDPDAALIVSSATGQGAKGDKGDPGAKGATGAQGATGPKGDKGAKGDPGPAVKTFAVCAQPTSSMFGDCNCLGGSTLMSEVSGPCTAVSDSGSCTAISQGVYLGQCCVCKPL